MVKVKRLLKLALVGLTSLLLVGLFPLAVLAVDDPDSISIPSIRVFQNLWEAGDQLFLVEQKVMYGTDPDEDATDTFLVGVYASSNYTRPLPYYDHGLSAIYLTSAQAIVWESAANVSIYGNPAYFSSINSSNSKTVALSGGNWVLGTQEESRAYLQAWCITLAGELEDSWGITLLGSGDKLNAIGADYFQEIIPGLSDICPGLFAVSTGYVDPDEDAHSKAYETDLLARMGVRLTSVVQGFADTIHLPFTVTGLLMVGIMFFIVAGRVFTATGSPTLTIPIAIPFLFATVIIGLIPLSAVFMAVAVVIVLAGVTFVLGRIG